MEKETAQNRVKTTLTREQALSESEFHANGGCSITVGPRGGIKTRMEIWHRNGMPQTWIRTDAVRVPVRYGMGYGRSSYSYVRWPENAGHWHTRENCPVIRAYQTPHGGNDRCLENGCSATGPCFFNYKIAGGILK